MAKKTAESNYTLGTIDPDSVPRGGKQGQLIADEMEKIRLKNPERHLKAEDVVYYAQDEDHPLHKYFTWDDEEAAHRHRVQEAHHLIVRVNLIVPKRGKVKAVRAYVRSAETGYEPIEEAMNSPETRQRMLRTAFNDIQRMRDRYNMLEELSPLWRSIDRLEKQIDPPPKITRKTGKAA